MTTDKKLMNSKDYDYVLAVDKRVYMIWGGVTGDKAFIVKDKNQFTSELNKKYILAAASTSEILDAKLKAEDYFKEVLPEVFI